MKITPYQPPNPITDPEQRIAFLRTFLGRVTSGITTKEYYGFCEKVRSDIGAIQSDDVRTHAKLLFEGVLSARGFITEFPDKLDVWVRPKIESLISYLEAHDK
ncbi:MAG: hypothetical protein ABSF60_09990 [Verrucomicrobiota bacterium]|jgi:hypothetical protein